MAPAAKGRRAAAVVWGADFHTQIIFRRVKPCV